MNVKERVFEELDALVLEIAGAYNELIPEQIENGDFDLAVKLVGEARDTTADNLLELIKETIREATTTALAQRPVSKEDRLKKLVPPPVAPPSPTVELASPEPTKPVLLGESQSLPREADAPVDVYANKETIPVSTMSTPSFSEAALTADMAPDEEVGKHNLGLTVEQEKRMEAGLPAKPLRPTIHIDHSGSREKLLNEGVTPPPVAPTPTLPIPEPAPPAPAEPAPVAPPAPLTPVEKDALHRIQDIMIPYREDKDRTLAMLACSVLTAVSEALAQEDDTSRYSGVQMLWGALTSAIQKLRKLEKDVKFEGDILELRATVAGAVEDILATVATYPLPDEAPTEEPIVSEKKMEDKDASDPR